MRITPLIIPIASHMEDSMHAAKILRLKNMDREITAMISMVLQKNTRGCSKIKITAAMGDNLPRASIIRSSTSAVINSISTEFLFTLLNISFSFFIYHLICQPSEFFHCQGFGPPARINPCIFKYSSHCILFHSPCG